MAEYKKSFEGNEVETDKYILDVGVLVNKVTTLNKFYMDCKKLREYTNNSHEKRIEANRR